MRKVIHKNVMVAMAIVLVGCSVSNSSARMAHSKPECETVEYIEALNDYKLKQVARIQDASAKLLIALDPALSAPEFKYEGYRDKYYMAEMKRLRLLLAKTDIDEVVIWKLPRPEGMGVAVPFKE